MSRNTDETRPEAEASVYIDDSAGAFKERLELCRLRTEGYSDDAAAPELAPFFNTAFALLKKAAGEKETAKGQETGESNEDAEGRETGGSTGSAEGQETGRSNEAAGAAGTADGGKCTGMREPVKACPAAEFGSCGENAGDVRSDKNLCKPEDEKLRNELCKLCEFWLMELSGLCPLKEDGSEQDLVMAWETTLQLLLEAETALQEHRRPDKKEWKNILYSYIYDYAGEHISEARERSAVHLPVSVHFITSLYGQVLRAAKTGGFSAADSIPDPADSAAAESPLAKNPASEKPYGGKASVRRPSEEKSGPETADFLESCPAQVRLGMELFFGDRLKAKLLEFTKETVPGTATGENSPDNSAAETGKDSAVPEVKLTQHQRTALSELLKKAAAMCMLLCAVLCLAACGGGEGTEETEEETTAQVKEKEYPGLVAYQSPDSKTKDYFGVMHATVLDVQAGEKDGLFVYTLRDKEDPDNVWCLNSQNVGSIFCDVTGGKKVSVLFSGDIEENPDAVEFIAILDDAAYVIRSAAGSTVRNMMNSFVIRNSKGAEMTFIKDNCKVDKDALSTDGSVKILVYYAGTGSGNLYPVRVYKQAVSKK